MNTNAPTTSSALGGVDLNTPEGCVNAAVNVQNNYKDSMLLIVEKWTAPKEWGGHELPIEQLAEAIKRSPKTLKTDYVSVLRKQGRLPKATTGSATHKPIVAGSPATSVENSTPKTTTPNATSTNDKPEVRLPQSSEDTCPVVEPEVLPCLQVGGPEVDIRSFTPVLEQLLFGIEAARRNSTNTVEEWGSLTAMLQSLYHHAQCESKQRRIRREREGTE